jgi:hypothetical protein
VTTLGDATEEIGSYLFLAVSPKVANSSLLLLPAYLPNAHEPYKVGFVRLFSAAVFTAF